VARKLLRRDIVSDIADFCSFDQELRNHMLDPLLRSSYVLVSM
jgi:hypothetical protein